MTQDPSYPNTSPPGAQQLGYSAGARGKPGILTAVGIISILIGLLGALFSLSTLAQAVMFGIVFPKMSFAPSVMTPPPPTAVPAAPMPATAPAPATAPSPGASAPGGTAIVHTVSVNFRTPVSAAYVVGPAGGPPATTPAAGPTPATGPTTAPFVFPFNIDRVTMITMLADGIIGFALAVFLFVLGIITLTGSRRARWGHLLWAWLKLPAVALGFVSTMGLTQSMTRGVMSMPTPTGAPVGGATPTGLLNTMAIIQATMMAVIALIYPIAILIVMRTKRVKEYYEAGAGSGIQ